MSNRKTIFQHEYRGIFDPVLDHNETIDRCDLICFLDIRDLQQLPSDIAMPVF